MDHSASIPMLLAMLLPIAAGLILLIDSARIHLTQQNDVKGNGRIRENEKTRKIIHWYTAIALIASVIATVMVVIGGGGELLSVVLVENIRIYFCADTLSLVFVSFTAIVWLLVALYSFSYMAHEGEERFFFGFYLMLYGVLMALDFAGNLVTMYGCFELMTLVSLMLVLHNGSHESIMAAMKYLLYSMCGAYLGLFAIFYLNRYCDSLTFTPGGTLTAVLSVSDTKLLLAAVFCAIIGFGAKAGMFPLHAWLPSAHPVAPSPASAVLSGIIAKCGVFAIIRVVYYIVGADFIRGTWVQTAWMVLALLTVFMGSMLAYREPVTKKRFAYSTVSQVSYILFGLSLLVPQAFCGALLHVIFHALIKTGLFLSAGIFLVVLNRPRAEQLRGIGEKMPVMLWCYTFFALALVGIPPTAGFVSKWHLAVGSLDSQIAVFDWFGPVVLLVSALLTAGYLLPISLRGFFPGEENPCAKVPKKEPDVRMLLPLIILAVMIVALGVVPNPLTRYLYELAVSLM